MKNIDMLEVESHEFFEYSNIESRDDKGKFEIDNDQKAEWALKKIADISKRYNRFSEVCHSQISFYQHQQDEAKKKYEMEKAYFVSLLARYFETVEPKKTKTQAVFELPSGKLVKKFEKPELKPDNEMLAELLKDTEFVELKPNFKWGEYKKTLKIYEETYDLCGEPVKNYRVADENGELVEGVAVEVKPESFDVKVIE